MRTSNKHCQKQAGKHGPGSQGERVQSCKWKAGNGAASGEPYPCKSKGIYCRTAAVQLDLDRLQKWRRTTSLSNLYHCSVFMVEKTSFCHSEPLRFQFKTVLVLPLCTPLTSQAPLACFFGGAAARFHHICLFSRSNKSSLSTQGGCSSPGSSQQSSLHLTLCWRSLTSPRIFFQRGAPHTCFKRQVPSRHRALHVYLLNFRRLLLVHSSCLCPF